MVESSVSALPLAFLARFSLRCRIVGACVSQRISRARSCRTASKADVDQKDQRHVECCEMTPPMIGPTVGPSSGMKVYRLSDLPRSSGRQQSPRRPLLTCSPVSVFTHRSTTELTENAAAAPAPLSTRPAITVASLCANPHTIFQTRNQVDETCSMTVRPYSSESGDQRKGPNA